MWNIDQHTWRLVGRHPSEVLQITKHGNFSRLQNLCQLWHQPLGSQFRGIKGQYTCYNDWGAGLHRVSNAGHITNILVVQYMYTIATTEGEAAPKSCQMNNTTQHNMPYCVFSVLHMTYNVAHYIHCKLYNYNIITCKLYTCLQFT